MPSRLYGFAPFQLKYKKMNEICEKSDCDSKTVKITQSETTDNSYNAIETIESLRIRIQALEKQLAQTRQFRKEQIFWITLFYCCLLFGCLF
jgi:hypothetical protein